MNNPLKSVDFKGVAVDHGEKIALGTIGLVVVLVLLTGTRWSGTEKRTYELESQVDAAEQAIERSQWPEEQQKQLAATMQGPAHPANIVEKFVAQRDPADGEFQFDKENGFIWAVGGSREPIREPEWLALMEPVADAGTIVLDVPAGGVSAGAADGEVAPLREEEPAEDDAEKEAEEPEFDQFVRRGNGDARAGQGLQVRADAPREDAAGFGPDGEPGEPGTESSAPSGFATPYIAVRMVFPFREQLKEILKARHEQFGAQAEDLLRLHDFVIERQRTMAGTDEWSEWEEFDLTQTLRLLDVVTAFETDIVAPQVVDPVVTMPLPIPKYGFWGENGKHAIHPRVERYRLSEQQQELTTMSLEALMDVDSRSRRFGAPGAAFAEPGAEPDVEHETEPRGWAGKMYDPRELVERVMGDETTSREYKKTLNERIGQRFGRDVERAEAAVPDPDARYAEYVLFRFVDFDVHPNRKYRYRARLVVRNPNYAEPLDRVAHPAVPEGEFRETDWSPPTESVGIEEDLEYFVVATEPSTKHQPPGVVVNVHQWSPRIGTWVEGTRTVETGERIGGTDTVKTEVVNLIEDSFEEEGEFAFDTRDVLVDVVELPEIDFRDERHKANLKLPKGISLQPETPAIVADENGELAELDPLASEKERSLAERRMAAIKRGFEYLKQAEEAEFTGDALDAGLDEFGNNGKEPPEEARGKNRRFYNALRRREGASEGEVAPD